jgi:hypothetical protein
MARMWRGPTAELKKRRSRSSCGPRSIAAPAGSTSSATSSMTAAPPASSRSKSARGWYRIELGTVRGADPMLTALWGAHRFTPLDAELLQLHHAYLERLAEEIAHDGGSVVLKLGQARINFCRERAQADHARRRSEAGRSRPFRLLAIIVENVADVLGQLDPERAVARLGRRGSR